MAILRIIISLGFEKWNRSSKLETLEEVTVKFTLARLVVGLLSVTLSQNFKRKKNSSKKKLSTRSKYCWRFFKFTSSPIKFSLSVLTKVEKRKELRMVSKNLGAFIIL